MNHNHNSINSLCTCNYLRKASNNSTLKNSKNKYNILVSCYASFSVPNGKLKKNPLKIVILIRSFIEEKEALQEQLLKFIFQPVLGFSKKMNQLKFFIYFLFYIFQEKTNYNLKFRNCSNRVLLTISKSNLYKVLNND